MPLGDNSHSALAAHKQRGAPVGTGSDLLSEEDTPAKAALHQLRLVSLVAAGSHMKPAGWTTVVEVTGSCR